MSARPAPELAPHAARLAPYARASLQRAIVLAARLHAEELSPEHWLVALLADESCAATRVVLHAFADPETIGVEVLALCAGIMVVGSGRTLPFSVLGVAALEAARERALALADAHVEPADLFRASSARLTPVLRARLALLSATALEAGAFPLGEASGATVPAAVPAAGPAAGPVTEPGSAFFRPFSGASLRALGASARAAASLSRTAIGPAHLLLGALEVDGSLRDDSGLSTVRVRMACSGLDEDLTPLPERQLAGDARLRALLAELPPAAETLDVLSWMLARGSEEMTAVLLRQKVTPILLARCRGVYQDPAGPT